MLKKGVRSGGMESWKNLCFVFSGEEGQMGLQRVLQWALLGEGRELNQGLGEMETGRVIRPRSN